jgi:hypothetical protein
VSEPQDLLSMLFGMWKGIGDETVRCLGDETASLCLHLAEDSFAIRDAILEAYPQEELLHSLVFIEFAGVLKELGWLHAMFVCGNYPLVLRQLRFNWERIFRALLADADGPGPTVDDNHAWLTQREKPPLDWNRLIAPLLGRLSTAGALGKDEAHYKALWDRLNRCVHPSGYLRERLVSESDLLAIDAFDEPWARETHADAAEVFGVVWLAVLSRFPRAVSALLADPQTFRVCPRLRGALEP